MSGWQDMSTAPMDGTPILLFARAKNRMTAGRVVGWYREKEGWVELSYRQPVGLVPYCWCPLPDFPPWELRKAFDREWFDPPRDEPSSGGVHG